MRTDSSRLRCVALAFCLLLPSCMLHEHRVGTGAIGTGSTSQRQYYWFFGLARINEVDTQRYTEDVVSYDIETEMTFTDLLLSTLLAPISITTRTVTVKR